MILALTVGALATGCTSSRVFQTSGVSTSVSPIADVQVLLDPGFTPTPAYHSVSMSGTIRHALITELRREGKMDTTGATLEFTVTGFRLRSGSTVFWVGVMAGGDHVSGRVTVRRGDAVLKTFDVSAKGIDSAWSGMFRWRLSAGRRADRFARMIAEEIVKQL